MTNLQTLDSLTFNGLPPPLGITVSGSGTGVITITGSASAADYQTWLQQIEFSNPSAAHQTSRASLSRAEPRPGMSTDAFVGTDVLKARMKKRRRPPNYFAATVSYLPHCCEAARRNFNMSAGGCVQ